MRPSVRSNRVKQVGCSCGGTAGERDELVKRDRREESEVPRHDRPLIAGKSCGDMNRPNVGLCGV